jgi:hypothetical protein
MVGLAGFELLNVTCGLVSLGLFGGPIIKLGIACVKELEGRITDDGARGFRAPRRHGRPCFP